MLWESRRSQTPLHCNTTTILSLLCTSSTLSYILKNFGHSCGRVRIGLFFPGPVEATVRTISTGCIFCTINNDASISILRCAKKEDVSIMYVLVHYTLKNILRVRAYQNVQDAEGNAFCKAYIHCTPLPESIPHRSNTSAYGAPWSSLLRTFFRTTHTFIRSSSAVHRLCALKPYIDRRRRIALEREKMRAVYKLRYY